MKSIINMSVKTESHEKTLQYATMPVIQLVFSYWPAHALLLAQC